MFNTGIRLVVLFLWNEMTPSLATDGLFDTVTSELVAAVVQSVLRAWLSEPLLVCHDRAGIL